ncbi:histone deacetylase complex subunit SAP25 isoform X2 [Nycticebus coucang]|uniref:histone deacetylase complex subunit SAP25 isoform X2 n=1 Tax=Nycticebus coucang TaxID=9470 RepID=UPI00234CA01D|nr:histone deacetylase complex subunit SAP25 isoform X2 [Nycticebus coucang]
MLPWPPPRWGAVEEEVPAVPGPLEGSDQGEAWSSGEEALGEPGTPPQDSPQPQALTSSWTQRGQLQTEELPPCHHLGLIPDAEHSLRSSVPLSPQMIREVAPSRMSLLAPWDPNYQAKSGPQLVWGASYGSGASFTGRTLCHPSFWPLYEAASSRGIRPRTFMSPGTGPQNGEWAVQDTGLPVMCREDVFLCDPLLPCGQRVPLYLSEAPQQVMGSLKLLLPPPVMSPWVLPSRSQSCSTAWLSGPELIALTGLLQMSQGEPRPNSSSAPAAPAVPPDPPGSSGGPSCSHCTDPSLPQTPDTHCP